MHTFGSRTLTVGQYHIYLFERILLCCKDINPNKQKKLIPGKDKPTTTAKGKARLQLKGRIYMANVTDIVCLQKPGMWDYKTNYWCSLLIRFPQAPIGFKSSGKVTREWWTISQSGTRTRIACANGPGISMPSGQSNLNNNATLEAPVLPKPNSCT